MAGPRPSHTGWGDKALPFLAVGRVKDQVTLAYYSNTDTEEQKDQCKEVFKKLLQAAQQKLNAGQKTRLQWNDGAVCCLMDQKGMLLYCVVTSLLTYPERLAFQLLYEFMVTVQKEQNLEERPDDSLTEPLTAEIRKLVLQYEDSKNFPHFHERMEVARSGNRGAPINEPSRGSANITRRSLKLLCVATLLVVAIITILIVVATKKAAPSSKD